MNIKGAPQFRNTRNTGADALSAELLIAFEHGIAWPKVICSG